MEIWEIDLESLSDGELQELYWSGLYSESGWNGSRDGSDGAAFDHEVLPVIKEARRRGITLNEKREGPLYVKAWCSDIGQEVLAEVTRGGLVGKFCSHMVFFISEDVKAHSEKLEDLLDWFEIVWPERKDEAGNVVPEQKIHHSDFALLQEVIDVYGQWGKKPGIDFSVRGYFQGEKGPVCAADWDSEKGCLALKWIYRQKQ